MALRHGGRLWALGIAGIVAATALAACGSAGPSVPTVTAQKGDFIQTVQAAGVTVASSQAKLAFRVSGRVSKIDVAVGDSVTKGQVLAELDPTDANTALQQAQAADNAAHAAQDVAQAKVQQLQDSAKPANIAQANAALDAAKQKLSLAQSGARKEQVQAAQANLQSAQAKLQALQQGPRPEQVAILNQQISAAKNSLFAAQTARDGACNKVAPAYLCSAGQAQVDAAQTAVDTAQKQLQLATAPPTATDLQQAQAAVDAAQAQVQLLQSNTPQDIQAARDAVTQASAAADLAAKPYTAADMAATQAAVEQAKAQVAEADASLAAAREGLASTRLTAPADGKILQVNNAVGELVGGPGLPGTGATIVLGSGGMVVNAGLPAVSLAQVKVGDPASVTFASLPGTTFSAKVTALPTAGTTTQDIVSYVVTIALDKPDARIRPGLDASVVIDTVHKQGVLLVPSLAVQSYQGKDIVLIPQASSPPKQVPVQVGLANARQTEILSGLNAGQKVLLVGRLLNNASLDGGN
ncbi:MAG TPA: biotin/lipoyl-binding protein [Chloroflexota bacterium]|nr:biotin/lipoyl-binding protein [Chloroflexota bacterium]